MADDSEERNLPASDRKLQTEREKGNVPRSKDFNSFIVLLAALIYLGTNWQELMRRFQTGIRLPNVAMPYGFEEEYFKTLTGVVRLFFDMVLPMFFIILGATLFAMLMDAKGFPISTQSLTPNFGKLNPMEGLKKIFTIKSLVELAKGITNIVVVFAANIILFRYYLNDLIWAPSCGVGCVTKVFVTLIGTSVAIGLVVLLIIAAIDFPLSRVLFKRDQKMSVTEAKREYKESNGDPHVKAARARMEHEMMETAGTVGMNNATILLLGNNSAVAITYIQGKHEAPIIAARAKSSPQDMIAAARARNLLMVQESQLVEALLVNARPGQFVPQELFSEVGRVLIRNGLIKV